MIKRIKNAIRWRSEAALEKAATALGTQQTHWSRVVMDQETARYVTGLHPGDKSALEISGDKWKDFGFASYRSVDFEHYDVCSGVLEERFDVIIIEQVLEHLLWPYRAVRNLHEMLKPGGKLVVTTPFLLRVHDFPIDCSRWTELGLKHLLAEGGFDLDKMVSGSWGNKRCVIGNLAYWFPRFNPNLHSLKNEPDYPIVVWCFAAKS